MKVVLSQRGGNVVDITGLEKQKTKKSGYKIKQVYFVRLLFENLHDWISQVYDSVTGPGGAFLSPTLTLTPTSVANCLISLSKSEI